MTDTNIELSLLKVLLEKTKQEKLPWSVTSDRNEFHVSLYSSDTSVKIDVRYFAKQGILKLFQTPHNLDGYQIYSEDNMTETGRALSELGTYLQARYRSLIDNCFELINKL